MATAQLIKAKYAIKKCVSEDLISFTYSGIREEDQQKVILIRYKNETLSPKLIRKLIRLAETTLAIQHPSLLKLLDYDYDGNSFFTIYEGGESLVSIDTPLSQGHAFTVKELWDITTQILGALVALEMKGVTFGLLNVSHIYLTPDKQVKLIGAVLAIEVLQANFDSVEVVEDCMFFAPEFVQGHDYNTQSEIYSFGMLLYYFFSRKWPFPFTNEISQLKERLLSEPKNFHTQYHELPERVDEIISICLKREPEHRFSSFRELIKTYKGEISPESVTLGGAGNGMSIQEELRQSIKAQTQKKKKERIKIIAICGMFVLFLLSSLGLYEAYLTGIPEVTVPDVRGFTQEEASIVLAGFKLKSEVAGQRFHPTVEQGLVIETKPPDGRKVKENRKIRLFFSKGPIQFQVSDLRGRTIEQSRLLLRQYGERLVVSGEEFSVELQKGLIVSQSPSPNSYVSASENIQVVLSRGYPVAMTVKDARNFFFQKKDHLRQVMLTLYVLEQWEAQEITIYFTYKGQSEKIYLRKHFPGEKVELEFELDYEGVIEVYFNDELAYKGKVKNTGTVEPLLKFKDSQSSGQI